MSPALSVAEGRFKPTAVGELEPPEIVEESEGGKSGATAVGKFRGSVGVTGSNGSEGSPFPSSIERGSSGASRGETGSLNVPGGSGGKGAFSEVAASPSSRSGNGSKESGLETGKSSPPAGGKGGNGGKDCAMTKLYASAPITKQATCRVVLVLQTQCIVEGFIDGQF